MLSINLSGLPALFTAIAISALITWFFIPRIIKVASIRHLTDSPGPRKVHKVEIPTLGGVGIFAGFSTGFLITFNGTIEGGAYIFASMILLFFVGIIDDLINLNAVKKLGGEILAAVIISCFTSIHITNFHGFLGIYEIPVWCSFLTTLFVFVVIINSFNLIDGIDGLATSTGIVASSVLGAYFWYNGDPGYALMAAALIGALVVFLFFNISKGEHKIFMGDTGSLIIGLILSILTIRFNEINVIQNPVYNLTSAPAISIAILIVPLFDTIRVFTLRILNRQSPFQGDKRHIHHLMLQAGCSHRQATLLISLAHLCLIAVAFLLDHAGIVVLTSALFVMCLALTELIKMKVRFNIDKQRLSKVADEEEKEIKLIPLERILTKKSV